MFKHFCFLFPRVKKSALRCNFTIPIDNACQDLQHDIINNFTRVAVSPFANLARRSTLRRYTCPLFILSICSISFSSRPSCFTTLSRFFVRAGNFVRQFEQYVRTQSAVRRVARFFSIRCINVLI